MMETRVLTRQGMRYELPEGVTPQEDLENGRLTHIDVIQEMVFDDDLTPRATSPSKRIPYPDARGQTTLRRGGGVTPTRRPRVSRRVMTAPPGFLGLWSAVSEPLRRATSAWTASHTTANRCRSKSQSLPHSTRHSWNGRPSSRSIISRRKSNRRSVGRLGLKPQAYIWREVPVKNLHNYETLSSALEEDRRKEPPQDGSRARAKFQSKNAGVLQTNIIDFNSRGLPDTPGSFVSTPREMYGFLAITPTPGDSRHRYALQTVSSNKSRSSSLAMTPESHEAWKEHELGPGSALSSRSPVSSVWKHHVYVTGPIRLEDHKVPPMVRKDSIATLEPFIGEFEGSARRASDDAALDGIVSFFRELEMVETSGEDGLDRFWEDCSHSAASPAPLAETAHPPNGPRMRSRPPMSPILLPPPSACRLQDESPTTSCACQVQGERASSRPGRQKLSQLWSSAPSIL
ncbi:hypothetical protein BCR34DRAFT_63799 [Clohesyomyces aquaticus]|uniref:Uncharacterized protein n=1 Tax=Clohesyomyces aquaticus TaxID=1231657 RepID=A0A1Y1Z266_9PLEO|nr:hypothetical protein BCR34DRAFT_63799 [Clohesyomyces aquaticus]